MRRVVLVITLLTACSTIRQHPRPAAFAISTVGASALMGVPLAADCYECDAGEQARPFGYGALIGAAMGTIAALELEPTDL